jgi:hypothetical protein
MPQYRKPTPKTQRQISEEQHVSTYPQYGNPNAAVPPLNDRATKISWKGDNVKPFSIGIKDIDEAVLYYLQNVIKPFVIQNSQRIEVPIIYGSPERWKSVQKDGYYKDKNGAIMLPLMIFKRDSIEKVRSVGNKLDANYPNNFEVFEKKYTARNAYDSFNVLNDIKPQKEYYAVVIPDYVNITYSCIVSTYYVEQLNKIVEAVNYASDAYWGDPERYKFRVKIDTINTPTELTQDSIRLVKANFNMVLNGQVVPDLIQKDLSAINKFFNKTKTIFSIETVSQIPK